MMLHVDDDGFVRAPAPLVYRRLTDIGSWSRWWPGVTATAVSHPSGRETWALDLRRNRLLGVRLAVQPHGYRHEQGFKLALYGDLAGQAEFWLERVAGGTVVHHLVSATAIRAPVRTLTAYRVVLRRGLWGFKDRLQTEVRSAIGVPP